MSILILTFFINANVSRGNENLIMISNYFPSIYLLSSKTNIVRENKDSLTRQKICDSLYGLALKQYKEKNLPDALDNLDWAISYDYSNPYYNYARGLIMYDMIKLIIEENGELGNDYPANKGWPLVVKAKEAFQKVIDRYDDSKDPSISKLAGKSYCYYGIMVAEVNLYLKSSYQKGNAGSEVRHLLKGIKIDSTNIKAYYYLGKYCLEFSQYDDYKVDTIDMSVKYFKKIIELTAQIENKKLAYQNLRHYYSYKKNNYEIINCNNELLKFDPLDYDAMKSRGIAKYELNDLNGALIDFNSIIDKNPNEPVIYRFRAKSLFKKSGNFKTACPDMKKASELGDEEATRFMNEVCK